MADTTLTRLTDVCEKLKEEPLLSMSLGSRELFHSNFLVWYADRFPQPARFAFATWTHPTDRVHAKGHERESKHLDAILRFPGYAPIVIENKTFSVPVQKQLDEYRAHFDEELKGGSHILLTLMDPGYQVKDWRVVRYADLADAIEAQLDGVDSSTFAGQVVRHYVRFIRLLVAVIAGVGVPILGAALPLPDEQARMLSGIRMDAAIQKARASWVAAEIQRLLGSDAGRVNVNSGFTNGRSLVQGFFSVPNTYVLRPEDSQRDDAVGWQLQGDQFRLAVITYNFMRQSRAVREAYVERSYKDWFNLNTYHALTGRNDPLVATRRRRGQETRFQAYDPNFSYRYVPCRGLTVDEIIQLGMAYSRAALKWVQR